MGLIKEKMRLNMELSGFSPNTIKTYLSEAKRFVKFYNKSPLEIQEDEVKNYLHQFIRNEYSNSTVRQAYSAIKFLLVNTLNQEWFMDKIPVMRKEHRLPIVLNLKKINAIFNATEDIKYRALFKLVYSSGLRIGEAIKLKVTDVDSRRMTIRVEQGKNRKDRYTILSFEALKDLRTHWQASRPWTYLFPGLKKDRPITPRPVQTAFQKSRMLAGVKDYATLHSLRHSFATHLLETGCDIMTIKSLLGHSSVRTTTIYLHVRNDGRIKIQSPLDLAEGKVR